MHVRFDPHCHTTCRLRAGRARNLHWFARIYVPGFVRFIKLFGAYCVCVRAYNMQSVICIVRRNEGTQQCGRVKELTFRLWLRDLTALLCRRRGRGKMCGHTRDTAMSEQHTTSAPCLKIHRVVEPAAVVIQFDIAHTVGVFGCHLRPPVSQPPDPA